MPDRHSLLAARAGTQPHPLVIYHGNCADGFSAAWVFHHYFKRCTIGRTPQFVAGRYGEGPPDVTGREVYLVDFSFKRAVVQEMVDTAARVTLIDHHATAIADLADLPGLIAYTDLERCGATLAWDYLFPGEPRPLLLGHVEDRDLWRFKLPHTREIQAAVFAMEYTFENWDRLMAAAPHDLVVMTAQGAAIERKHRKDVAELVSAAGRYMTIGGTLVPVANLPYTMASDAGEKLARMCRDFFQRDADLAGLTPDAAAAAAFGATYYDTAEHRHFSLRSLPDGADVSAIAQQYGGGGHRHAAGFRVPRDHKLAQA